MNKLHDLCCKFGDTDKGRNGYIDKYEIHFESLREQVKSVFELGVLSGGSLRMWKEYFPNAQIYGLDVDVKGLESNTERIKVYNGSQGDINLLDKIINDSGGFDIVIDDASHLTELQEISYRILSPATKIYYVIEDLVCSYVDLTNNTPGWPGMDNNKNNNVSFKNDRSIINKMIIDAIKNIDGKNRVKSLHSYPMILFMEYYS